MSKIISVIIKILNRINKIIWKFIIFLSKFIKIDEVKHLDNKPDDVKYRLFNVDEPDLIEPFVKIEHKDYKQLIKDNNINLLNVVMINLLPLMLNVLVAVHPKIIFMIILVSKTNLNVRSVLISFLLILIKIKMLF